MILLKQLTIFVAAFSMIAAAFRHREWRGGFLLAGCVFLAVAMNEFECLFRPLFPGMHEPELVPIVFFSVLGALLAFMNYGTSIAALKAIYDNRRFPLLVWGLLLSTVLPNVAMSRGLWQSVLPVVTDSHSIREVAEHAVEFLGYIVLLNWAILFLKDKWTRLEPRSTEHEHLLHEYPLIEVGRGTRRVCYKIGDTGFCAKFYISPEECSRDRMKRSIRWDIFWRRFNKFKNSCSQEVHVWAKFRHRMPKEIIEAMPPVMERVYHPEWGWGVLETYYTNPDGTAIIPYEYEIMRQTPENREVIYAEAKRFLDMLIAQSAFFYEPGNLHVLIAPDGTLSLRIVDFEPSPKTAIPLELVWPWLRRRKLMRKSERYLRHIRDKYAVKGIR